jgi:thiol-disulfide isomerase/thioredoxin
MNRAGLRLPQCLWSLYTAAMESPAAFYRIAAVYALFSIALSGCGQHIEATQNQSAPNESAAHGVSLQILDYDRIQKLIAAHRGQVVVLDCWSTSCPPCIEEFPKLVALHNKYDPSQVACISLSFDFEGIGKPENVRPDVLIFLQDQQATFENVLGNEASDVLLKKMGLASIPAVFVYDRQGNVHRFEGSKAYDDVPSLVKQLVNER